MVQSLISLTEILYAAPEVFAAEALSAAELPEAAVAAAFGHVTSGMEVVDAIANDAKPTDNNGTIPKAEQPVITKITVTTP